MFKRHETKRLFDSSRERDTGTAEGTAYFTGKIGRNCGSPPDLYKRDRAGLRQRIGLQYISHYPCTGDGTIWLVESSSNVSQSTSWKRTGWNFSKDQSIRNQQATNAAKRVERNVKRSGEVIARYLGTNIAATTSEGSFGIAHSSYSDTHTNRLAKPWLPLHSPININKSPRPVFAGRGFVWNRKTYVSGCSYNSSARVYCQQNQCPSAPNFR